MKKILHLDHTIFKSEVQYAGCLTSKIIGQLGRYYEVKGNIYTWVDFKSSVHGYHIKKMPIKRECYFYKWLALIYVYKSNIKLIRSSRPDIIWIGLASGYVDFFAFIYPIFFRRRVFYVQLYTPSVDKNRLKRFFLNTMMSFTLKFFKNIGGRSSALSKSYHIPIDKLIPVDVGMPDYGFVNRKFDVGINLLYIGTLNGRDVWKTIKGLSLFLDHIKGVPVHYDIIGVGAPDAVNLLNSAIQSTGLEKIVVYHGALSTNDVVSLFNKANVGVSFVPLVPYYDGVPITKTIEYFLAGMPVIATSNQFNRDIVDDSSGILCDDTPDGFALGLSKYFVKRMSYNSAIIRDLYSDFSMEEIMKKKYIPFLDKLMKDYHR